MANNIQNGTHLRIEQNLYDLKREIKNSPNPEFSQKISSFFHQNVTTNEAWSDLIDTVSQNSIPIRNSLNELKHLCLETPLIFIAQKVDSIFTESAHKKCSTNRFEDMPIKELERNFQEAAKTGNLDDIQAIIYSKGFEEIGCLGSALVSAAVYGRLACLEAIMNSSRFGEIPSYKLGWALRRAGQEGHLACLQALIRHGCLRKLSEDDRLEVIEGICIPPSRTFEQIFHKITSCPLYTSSSGPGSVQDVLSLFVNSDFSCKREGIEALIAKLRGEQKNNYSHLLRALKLVEENHSVSITNAEVLNTFTIETTKELTQPIARENSLTAQLIRAIQKRNLNDIYMITSRFNLQLSKEILKEALEEVSKFGSYQTEEEQKIAKHIGGLYTMLNPYL